MTRQAHPSDVFTAIAEPRRRQVIAVLSDGHEHAVNEIVVRMKMAQSPVSKHLGALHRAVWSRSYNAASIACIDSTPRA